MNFPIASSGRPRPGAGFALWSWYFMRVSGIVMLFMVLFHLLWMHFVIGLENVNYTTIAARWTGKMGPFWRVYDLVLLFFAFSHGLNGVRWVIEDYVRSRGWRLALVSFLWVLYVVLMIAGAYIILSFQA